MAYQIFRDRQLLHRFRSQIATCADRDRPSGFDAEQLIKLPLLQSIWAETLRLRVHIFNTRKTGSGDTRINNWIIPRNSFALVASTPAHLNPLEWNSGMDGEHPVDTFWAERFIIQLESATEVSRSGCFSSLLPS